MNADNSIKFIGTGGIFDYYIGNSSAILESDFGNVLIDCGYTVYEKLVEKQLIGKIDYLLITHFHGDHVGSLHPLILHIANKLNKKIRIIYNNESHKMEIEYHLRSFLVDISNYVDFINIETFPCLGYIDSKDKHVLGIQSYAYYFKFSNSFLYYSGDLGDLSLTEDFLRTVDHNNIIVFHETSFLQGTAHVYYKDLMRLSKKYKLYAYHCNHLNIPNDCALDFVAYHDALMV